MCFGSRNKVLLEQKIVSDFSGQAVAHERKAPDAITEHVAALRQGSEANGRPWLEQELRGLAVSVLRSVATTLGVAIKEEVALW